MTHSAAKGKQIEGYLLGKTIGEGSFAKVKEAVHKLTNQKVAVKIIDKAIMKGSDYLQRTFRREALMLQKLNHKNVVRLYEVLETENHFYLVTELVSGGELMNYICARQRIDEKETRKYMRQIVSAVEYMHKAGVIHRDLKVENLLLDENNDIKIIDFGLSNTLGEGGHLMTQCGSPAYAAPEVFCQKQYGAAVDVWSIGINMYAMLTGELPFHVEPINLTALHAQILMGAKIPDHLSSSCQDLLHQLLQLREDKRIKVAEIMQHAWITNDGADALTSEPFPNFPYAQDIDERLLSRMIDHWGYEREQTVKCICENRASRATATYYLMHRMVKRLRAVRMCYSDSHLMSAESAHVASRPTGKSRSCELGPTTTITTAAVQPREDGRKFRSRRATIMTDRRLGVFDGGKSRRDGVATAEQHATATTAAAPGNSRRGFVFKRKDALKLNRNKQRVLPLESTANDPLVLPSLAQPSLEPKPPSFPRSQCQKRRSAYANTRSIVKI